MIVELGVFFTISCACEMGCILVLYECKDKKTIEKGN